MHYFGKRKIAIDELIGKGKQQISMMDVPIEKVCTYCCEDADYTFRLKQLLAKELDERELTPLMPDLELPLMSILADMERTGIYVDVPYLQSMSKEVAKQIRAMEGDIHEMAGELFNINSPKQLSEILFYKMGITPPKKTATGHSTDADVLESLQDRYPIAGKVLEYRTLEKLRSTYLDSLPSEVNPDTGRVHCTFNQSVAATGRLSCQDPNLQNIPIRSEIGRHIRGAFRPQEEGWSFLAADYSQIELRILAHLCDDPQLVDAFQHNRDVHAHTASVVFNVPLEEVTREMRHQAKAVNFGVIYGQQAFGLAKELHIDVKKAAEFIKTYFERYHAVQAYVEQCKELARKTGKAVTVTGRERIIPEINSKNGTIRTAAERLAVNTPLQGTAADLIKMAMLKVYQKLNESKLKAKMILQIHDELLFEVADEDVDTLKVLVKECMETVYPLRVPLVADIGIGRNWEEC
jgi:DNA polymerase-1